MLVDRLLWLGVGVGLGYAYGVFTSPAHIPCTEPGSVPVTQSAASALLTVGNFASNPNVRPVLVDMSHGQVPTLQEMYRATQAFGR